ncbi:high-potential iron-sulfur protein [Candidatus Kapabacteria bacterium]|nr:high-potential iron-sulfur protein [Candidatus Kapabacteria bacterium]
MSEEQNKIFSRRDLLKSAVSGVAVISGMAVITACGGSSKKAEPEAMPEEKKPDEAVQEKVAEKPESDMAANEAASNDPCSDLTGVAEDEVKKRNTIYQYKEVSDKEGQMCQNCQLYNKASDEGSCGGCQLFKGPVQSNGWCVSWVKNPKA